jgi:hypothetical protein
MRVLCLQLGPLGRDVDVRSTTFPFVLGAAEVLQGEGVMVSGEERRAESCWWWRGDGVVMVM